MRANRRLGALTTVVAAMALAAGAVGPAPALAQPDGKQLIERKGCLDCHTLMGRGGTQGPPLQSTPAWSGPDRMRQYIKDPRSVNPKSIMPKAALKDDEIDAIVTYLQGFKDDAEAPAGWKPK